MTEKAAPHQPNSQGESQADARSGGVEFHGPATIGRDVIGRDKNVQGDDITIMTGLTGTDLSQLFLPLMNAIHSAPPEKQGKAAQKAEALKGELMKGKEADDNQVAKLVDGLIELVPGAVSAVVSIFASPILVGVAGPVTKFMLDKLQGK